MVGSNKTILLIGISAQNNKQGVELEPFDSSTPSGKFVNLLEEALPCRSFSKTNLVPFAPLNKFGKVRYPTQKELCDSFDDVLMQIKKINPYAIILFGNIVGNFFCKQIGLNKEKYVLFNYHNRNIVCADHPSYIMIYKRKQLDGYVQKIVALL